MSKTHIVCPSCNATNLLPDDRLQDDPRCGKCKERIFSAHPMELNGGNFERHISKNDIPVLVDFWAPWCGRYYPLGTVTGSRSINKSGENPWTCY